MIDDSVVAHYRCPDEYADGNLYCEIGRDEARMLCGSEVIRCRVTEDVPTRPEVACVDSKDLAAVQSRGSVISLSLSAAEITSNLRYERYTGEQGRSLVGTWRRNLYYFVRPALGVNLRKHLQRIELRNRTKAPFPHWPVDCTVERVFERSLEESLSSRGVDAIPFIWFWPEGRNSCLLMTHDVEEREGLLCSRELIHLDAMYGIRASYQFIPEQRYTVEQDILDAVRAGGCELNLHDLNHDGHLYDDYSLFLRRAQKINQYAQQYGAAGFRAGMLYRKQSWFGAYSFSYDMSVPNVGHLDPQRGGCCTVFPYFIGNILEIPLTTTQDYTLFHILRSYDISLWKKQTETIIEHHGIVTFNIHPDYIRTKRERATYEALLQYLGEMVSKQAVFTCLPGELDNWWRARSQMCLVNDHGRLRIEGPQAERARIAWARHSDRGLTYELAR